MSDIDGEVLEPDDFEAFEDEEYDLRLPPLDSSITALIDDLRSRDSSWVPGERLELDSLAWEPHLISADRSAVLHVHVADRLRPFLLERMRLANEHGYAVHLVVVLDSLFDELTIEELASIDVHVHLVRDDEVPKKSELLLGCLADEGVPVSPEVRRTIAANAWSRRQEGTSQEKGKRLEGLLSFMFGQIEDFRIRARNFRGATDEIDIVVQVGQVSPRCWYESGVPFVLIEAKNWKDDSKVGQSEVSTFITKMRTKRGRCRIGIIVSSSGFTSDAELQEMKHATENIVVVLIGPDEMGAWISSIDWDQHLEDLVTAAMLA